MTDLSEVRACISTSPLYTSISCTDTKMHSLLVDKKIANVWWQLTDNERSVLADYILKHYLLMNIYLWGTGNTNCLGGVTEWKTAYCAHNAVIRFMLFGKADEYKIVSCYYKHPVLNTIHCFWSGNCFGLPVYPVSVIATAGPSFGHAICAFQIKNDVNDFNSWRFFQYEDSNIKPGNYQMPCGSGRTVFVQVCDVYSIDCGGYSYDIKAKWIFTDNCIPVLASGAPTPTPVPVFPVTINSSPSEASVVVDGGYAGVGRAKVFKGNLIEGIFNGSKQSDAAKSSGCGCKGESKE